MLKGFFIKNNINCMLELMLNALFKYLKINLTITLKFYYLKIDKNVIFLVQRKKIKIEI